VNTLAEAVGEAAAVLAEAGVPTPRRDAQVLIAHALGADRCLVTGHPERPLTEVERRAFQGLIARRRAREPVSQIVGAREFWSLCFRVTRDTLTPRPESETLVEAVLARVDRAAPLRVLDLGTGSGCLLLALLSELPNATGVGIDRSARALAVAAGNAASLGLADRSTFVVGDWGTAMARPFDVIVANPPYVPSSDLPFLDREVSEWERNSALDGGPDGLDAYRAILPDLPRLLAPDGLAALEVGHGQADAVVALASLAHAGTVPDLAGIPRCVLLGRAKLPLGNQREVH
jgi:release factor glutamine methyltransferase